MQKKPIVNEGSHQDRVRTIILIDYIDTYLSNVDKKTAFIWLCPGKGNLEEQSREKMIKLSPGRSTQNLLMHFWVDLLKNLLLYKLGACY